MNRRIWLLYHEGVGKCWMLRVMRYPVVALWDGQDNFYLAMHWPLSAV